MPAPPESGRRPRLLLCLALAGVALPALAQESLLPPTFNEAPPPAEQPQQQQQEADPQPDSSAREAARPVRGTAADSGGGLVESDTLSPEELAELPEPPPPVELPPGSERDPRLVGAIDPQVWGYGAAPWGSANGQFLSGLMRRLDTPLPSRWLHITLRNALLSRSPAPPLVNPVDWVAERAWLLLRMGEADAAAMLVAGVDVADFTDKMTQVAVQSALATADPAALCPLRERMRQVEAKVLPLTEAMCAAIQGDAGNASSRIEQARRRGAVGGIDFVLADKVVGAGADTGRAATVEWDGVEGLTAWRFGLATATGMVPPGSLLDRTPARVRAWQARAPLLSAEQRLPSARIAAGLGVFSSTALGDLYSILYDQTDASDLGETDAWQLRQAFVARDPSQRVAAMRRLWGEGADPLQRLAGEALVSLAATRIQPDAAYGSDTPRLIASMLAGGYDREAARWAGVVGDLGDEGAADRAWALLALGTQAPVDLSEGRIESFIDRDDSPDKLRSRLLVAGLAGTARIDGALATSLNQSYGLGIGRQNGWTRLAEQAGDRRQAGSATLLAAIGMQANRPDRIPSSHLYRALTAMRLAGLDFQARMVAAEMLART